MPRVPFIGRLHFQEYLALFLSFFLLGFESVARIITLALPETVIRSLYRISRKAFNSLSSPQGRQSRNRKRAVTSPIAKASDFVELCELFGYYAEEHVIQTGDGYLLGVHRLGWKKGEDHKKVNAGERTIQKKVVYLHHGLLMNSEVWVCLTEEERCLPFKLVEEGYDVWLGNNRGNKYSKKSVRYSPASTEFWNFSIDQFAFHDIPDSINYILETTSQKSLSYVGFSQGTAQAFATLSIHPQLNDKVDVFVALAPAMAPPGIASGVVSSFVKTSPEILFLLFGRKAILSSTTMWESLLYPGIFCWVIDKCLSFLFSWHAKNITPHQKLAAYPHLFSFTSTKSVVHWFQIIRNGTFQMYDDEVQAPLSMSGGGKYYKVAKFPTRNIKTPIVLLYGGSDSLVNIEIMLRELPKHTEAIEVPHYEHLDFLWASDVNTLVFPHVLEALHSYAGTTKAHEARTYRKPVPSPQPPSYSEAEQTTPRPAKRVVMTLGAEDDDDDEEDGDDDANDSDSSAVAARRRVFHAGHSPHPSITAKPAASPARTSDSSPLSASPASRSRAAHNANLVLPDDAARRRRPAGGRASVNSASTASSRGKSVGFGIGVGKAPPTEALADTAAHAERDERARRGRKK